MLCLLLAGLTVKGTTLRFRLEYLYELFPHALNFIQQWVQAYSNKR